MFLTDRNQFIGNCYAISAELSRQKLHTVCMVFALGIMKEKLKNYWIKSEGIINLLRNWKQMALFVEVYYTALPEVKEKQGDSSR